MIDDNMDKYSETDIRAKFIDPAIKRAGWPENYIEREHSYTDGQINVIGKSYQRGERKRVDYLLSYPAYHPIAIIEAKQHKFPEGTGMQQGINYAEDLQVPYVFTSNGDSFVFHNRLVKDDIEKIISMDEFPSSEVLFQQYIQDNNVNETEVKALETNYHYKKELLIDERCYYACSMMSNSFYFKINLNKTNNITETANKDKYKMGCSSIYFSDLA